jgi:hypothetical protein
VMARWTLRRGSDIAAIGDQGRRGAGNPIIGQRDRPAGTKTGACANKKPPVSGGLELCVRSELDATAKAGEIRT